MELQISSDSIILRYDSGKQSIWPVPVDTEGILEVLTDVLGEARKASGYDPLLPPFMTPTRPVAMASGVRERDHGDDEEIRLRNGGSALRVGVGELDIPIFDDDQIPDVNWDQ